MNDKIGFFLRAALIIIAGFVTACDFSNGRAVTNSTADSRSNTYRNMNESTGGSVEVNTDLENLEKRINLPVRPAEVKWTTQTVDNSKGLVPGPSDYFLTALLKYEDQTAAELIRRLETETPEKSLGNVEVKSWFTEDVKTQAKTVSGRNYLEGARYSFKSFARSPYSNGNLIRVGQTNFFILNLFSS